MLKAREILRLKHELGLSFREIGKACNCGKSTVSEVLERASKAQIEWPIELSDKQLDSKKSMREVMAERLIQGVQM